jgi:predicted RNA binding protein YcfA (HicA-like mRNA interferase family)
MGQIKKSYKRKEMIKLITDSGYKLVRQNGSHYKFYNPTSKKTIIFPVHNTNESKIQNYFNKVIAKELSLGKQNSLG